MGNKIISRNVCICSCSAVFWSWWSVCRCVSAYSRRHAGEHRGDRVRHPDAELWSDDSRPDLFHPHSHAHRCEVGVAVLLWKNYVDKETGQSVEKDKEKSTSHFTSQNCVGNLVGIPSAFFFTSRPLFCGFFVCMMCKIIFWVRKLFFSFFWL